jgi:uncharacterized protein YacL
MQAIWLARIFFVLVATLSGYWIGQPHGLGPQACAAAFFISIFVVALEYSTAVFSSKKILLAALGGFFGLAFSRLFYDTVPWPALHDPTNRISLTAFNLFFLYFGIILALRHADRLSLSQLRFIIANPQESVCLLDTNVIIDGRIKDLYSLGFMHHRAVVPQFILDELQIVADSSDPKRRSQGRRGLENLEELKSVHPLLEISEKDYPEIRDVDHKLLALAKDLGAVMVTNDYNLEKIAAVQQVKVLNLNELASALRPAIHVGEEVSLSLIREGKDPNQGVGYLEDGTMVVVDEGVQHIGRDLRVLVTSILHTSAGRMVFGRPATPVPGVPAEGSASRGARAD